jgi:aerobic carbon-monoxide dehydrogenase small subunit
MARGPFAAAGGGRHFDLPPRSPQSRAGSAAPEAAGGVGTKVAGPEKGLGARPLPGEYRRRLGLRRRGRYQIADGAGDAARGTGGEGMTVVSLTVNGKAVQREVEGRTLLVDLLREGLRLTGTHVGCDTSQCGACVVHIDGEPVKACSIFAADCEGAEVRTIEGMANPDGSLSVIQRMFQEHHGLQCGFCTPGMVMSAAALLKDNPQPSEHEIREYLDGNICRCTGYHNIVKAIQAAAAEMGSTRVAAE